MSRPDPATLLIQNVKWRDEVLKENPQFFVNLAKGQNPKILWIGCSDSRCPETTICGCVPGDIFTTRNIANLVKVDDPSVQAVINYAVNAVKVSYIIVVGHTKCGGVEAAWKASKPDAPPTMKWLDPLVQLSKDLGLDKEPEDIAIPRLTEESVKQQMRNVLDSINAPMVGVGGWIFELGEGLLRVVHYQPKKPKD